MSQMQVHDACSVYSPSCMIFFSFCKCCVIFIFDRLEPVVLCIMITYLVTIIYHSLFGFTCLYSPVFFPYVIVLQTLIGIIVLLLGYESFEIFFLIIHFACDPAGLPFFPIAVLPCCKVAISSFLNFKLKINCFQLSGSPKNTTRVTSSSLNS